MFSLIITIIAILLVIALALATVYFGGGAFTQGRTQAEAGRLLNEGQQINAALTLYRNDKGDVADSLEVLQPEYLAAGFSNWGMSEGSVYTIQQNEEVCLAFNKKSGVNTVPSCSDSAYAEKTVCCAQD